MTHDRARTLGSAWVDDELGAADVVTLRTHLDECAACTAHVESMRTLGDAVRAMPRLRPGPAVAAAVIAAVEGAPRPSARRTTGRTGRRLTPLALAAAAVAAVVAVVVGGGAQPGTPFAILPASAQTVALQRLTSVYLERDIVETPDGDAAQRRTVTEKVWWQAPDRLRLERTVVDAAGRRTAELILRRGADRYDAGNGRRMATRRGAPALDVLPEPLSPTVPLLGRPTGPGPVIAGRPTTTYELEIEGGRRVAQVDTARFVILGGADSFVLSKAELRNGVPTAIRTVRRLDLNVAIDPQRFELPEADEESDLGFVERAPGQLTISPPARPRGLRAVRAAAAGAAEALLFQRGAFPVLISTAAPRDASGPVDVQTTTVRGRAAVLRIPLYGYPSVTFTYERRPITLTSPLRPAELIDLAAQMYFPAE